MPESIQPILAAIGVVLLILAAVGSATAYFRASYAKATVGILGESNAALKEQVEILKGERDEDDRQRVLVAERHKTEQDELGRRLAVLERENGVLKEIVKGKADIDRLVMLIQDHHHEVIEDRRTFHTEWRVEIDKIQARLYAIAETTSEHITGLNDVSHGVGQVKGLLAMAATSGAAT